MKFTVNNFAGGANSLYDERILAPNQEGEPAETSDCENVEITGRGSLLTSQGFELVSSGSGTGGVKNIIAYEKDATTKQLVLTHDDDHYYITPASTVWTAIGDYGGAASNVGGVVYKGTASTRRVILGNDTTANVTQSWDGAAAANLGTAPDGWIMEVFEGRLFIASGATLYYTAVEDQTDWAGGGTISFPDLITGIKSEGEFLQVHTKRESFTIQMYYNDAFTLSSPLKKPYKNASGCLAHKTLISVFNDSYHLSRDGVQKLGADPNYLNQPLRSNSLSWKIDPSLFQSELSMNYIEKSCGVFYNKKAMFALPYGSTTYPSRIFQYNWVYDCWTIRTGIYPSGFAVFPDSNGRDQLYFASALGPHLYKFNNFWSYDGAGYTKKWTSKMFTFGSALIQKRFNFIDFAGAMYPNTTFYVDVIVDGVTVTYEINEDNLLQSSSGGYYADEYYGDITGGGEGKDQFYRYGARLYLSPSITEGRELQIIVRNQAAGEPWAVDMIQIDFDLLSDVQIPVTAMEASII